MRTFSNLCACAHAEGLYTELDFRNEGLNMIRMQQVLDASEFFDSSQIVIPKPFMDISSRWNSLLPGVAASSMLVCRRSVQG